VLIRIGEVESESPEGERVKFRVIQALDPIFQMPVAQIAVPIGEMSEKIGDAIAGRTGGADRLIVPDFIPPEELRPDER
jgi:hypothetical protein